MLTILQSRVIAKTTISTTFESCSTSHQLKMNPLKSFLGVSSGKFFAFIITSKEVHLDPDKVKAIHGMQPSRTLKEFRGLQGRLAYI